MPTGYTAAVQDGRVSEFAEFAMDCARAFGALVSMRDEPSSAAIPERFEPSSYHLEAEADARAELERLQSLSPEDAQTERDLQEAKRIAARANYTDRQNEQRDRYKAMLAKVRGWTPPTPDHVQLKTFMEKQLVESIDFDCRPSTYNADPLPDAEIWLSEKIAKAERDVTYHKAEYEKEVKRTESRNQWLSDLRESLKVKEPQ